MGAGIEDFGSIRAAFVGGDITVVALYIEGQPVRSATAAQRQSILQNRGHRIMHIPDVDVRVTPSATLPDLSLVGRPADAVQQSGFARRMVRDACSDDLTGLEIGDLHSP